MLARSLKLLALWAALTPSLSGSALAGTVPAGFTEPSSSAALRIRRRWLLPRTGGFSSPSKAAACG